MRETTKTKTTLLFVCLLAGLALAASPAGAGELTLDFDSSRYTSRSLVLDLGNLAVDDERRLTLAVALQDDQAARTVIAHVYGAGLTAEWEDGGRRTHLEPGRAAVLVLHLDVLPLSAASLHTVLLVDESDRPLAQVTLDFEVFARGSYDQTSRSGTMVSPSGKRWSRWFLTCVGPPSPGYELVRDSFKLSSPHNRRCGRWAKCEPGERSEDKVCWRFKIQGHDGGTWNPDESRKGDGVLTAHYQLVRSLPEMRELREPDGTVPQVPAPSAAEVVADGGAAGSSDPAADDAAASDVQVP